MADFKKIIPQHLLRELTNSFVFCKKAVADDMKMIAFVGFGANDTAKLIRFLKYRILQNLSHKLVGGS